MQGPVIRSPFSRGEMDVLGPGDPVGNGLTCPVGIVHTIVDDPRQIVLILGFKGKHDLLAPLGHVARRLDAAGEGELFTILPERFDTVEQMDPLPVPDFDRGFHKTAPDLVQRRG